LNGVSFSESATGFTFDNTAGLGSSTLPLPTVSKLSVAGTDGAFVAVDGLETGSPGLIANASNAIQVTRSGYVRDRRTGTYAQRLTLTNVSSTTLSGPFFVVLDDMSANATLANASGTIGTGPSGSPYVLVPGSSGVLSPGASLSVVLQISNPTNSPIAYSPRLLNGLTAP
jgi:hypothetical protein